MKRFLLVFLAISFATLASFLFGNGVFRTSPPAPAYAQELSDETVCQEKEIPVGQIMAQSGDLVRQVGNALNSMRTNYLLQKTAVKKLLELPDKCSVNACGSSCTLEVVETVCEGQTDARGRCLGELTPIYACGASACRGNPCPTSDIQEQVAKIIATHNSIVQANGRATGPFSSKEKIPSPFATADYCASDQCKNDYGVLGCLEKCRQRTWREHILFNLEEARKGLQACTTPTNFYDEPAQDVDFPMSCQEARLQEVLSEKQAQCFNNNFFCCTIRSTQ